MAVLADPEFWIRLFGIGVLNLLLSGDNALVIALAVRTLPRRKRRWWRFFVMVVLLLMVLVGGLALYVNSDSFAEMVRRKIIAEMELVTGGKVEIQSLSWSLFKVQFEARSVTIHGQEAPGQVAAAAHGDLLLVMFGLGLSLPIVIWGAAILARLMNRYIWIVWLGGGLLGYVAGEMMMSDSVIRGWLGDMAKLLLHPVPIVIGLVISVIGWWLGRGHRHARVPEKL